MQRNEKEIWNSITIFSVLWGTEVLSFIKIDHWFKCCLFHDMVIKSVLPHIEINMLWLTHTSTWVISIFSGKIIYQNKPDMSFLKWLGQKFTYSFLKDNSYW